MDARHRTNDFLLQHHNEIETAHAAENLEYLRALSNSQEYQAVFGKMSFDEAYDRYESMLEDGES